MIEIPDLFGFVGVLLGIFCYARLQWRRDFVKTLNYSLLNLVSSLFMMISIVHKFNLPVFINNLIWALLSFYGVYRCLKYSYRLKKSQSTISIN